MSDQINQGSRIDVKIVKSPTTAAAAKTLVRVLSKDAKNAAENKRIAKVRRKHFRTKRRGGRPYPIHMIKLRPLKGRVGESGTVLATSDVLMDLQSVSRFIEVSLA